MLITEKLLSLEEAANRLNVCKLTMRTWDNEGKLPAVKTKGGHRRYRESEILRFQGLEVPEEKENPDAVCVYARVSSHEQKQKGDLDRQKVRLLEACGKKKYIAEYVLTDVGSGISATRPKLKTLFGLVKDQKIKKVVVEHRDRLTRFAFGVYEAFFNSYGVEIEFLDDGTEKTYEQELVDDMIMLMSSFSSRIYGKRSAENKKARKLAKLTELAEQLKMPSAVEESVVQ
jgi:putative resolvase